MCKLSIITINRNNCSGLQRTMESVLSQSFIDYEFIIIDGDSTDGSKELVKNYADKLVYSVSEKDSGIYHAMNKGIQVAKGEYLLFLNSGDYFYSNHVLTQLFENSNNEDIIYGNMMIDRGKDDNNEVKFYPALLTFKYFFNGTLPHSSSLIKRELFSKIGLYNEDNKVVSDWEFFLKAICLHQSSYRYVNLIVSCFQPDGISSKKESVEMILIEKQTILDQSFKAFLPDYKLVEEEKQRAIALFNRLKLYDNSRMHRLAEKIMAMPFYRFIKSWRE